ncbi:MAG: hypothetical protein WCT39_03880 [Candidatus Margulisiibacteriota bacterium]
MSNEIKGKQAKTRVVGGVKLSKMPARARDVLNKPPVIIVPYFWIR